MGIELRRESRVEGEGGVEGCVRGQRYLTQQKQDQG